MGCLFFLLYFTYKILYNEPMKTQIIKINENNINSKEMEAAGKLIAAGELVAFPTETVYGLGGDALDPEAAHKIYAAKGRPSDNPLIVHIADYEDIYRVGKKYSKAGEAACRRVLAWTTYYDSREK